MARYDHADGYHHAPVLTVTPDGSRLLARGHSAAASKEFDFVTIACDPAGPSLLQGILPVRRDHRAQRRRPPGRFPPT